MPQVPEDAHGEAVTPLRFFKQKGAVHGRATGCQNPSLGRFGGATALQNEIVSPGFARRAGSLRPGANIS